MEFVSDRNIIIYKGQLISRLVIIARWGKLLVNHDQTHTYTRPAVKQIASELAQTVTRIYICSIYVGAIYTHERG